MIPGFYTGIMAVVTLIFINSYNAVRRPCLVGKKAGFQKVGFCFEIYNVLLWRSL